MARPVILIFEADEPIRDMLRLVLDEQGYQSIAAEAPSLGLVRLHQPALLLLDLLPLHPETGLDLLDELQHDPVGREIPVIVSSTSSVVLNTALTQLQRQGCRILEKPFSIDQLVNCIEQSIAYTEHRRVACLEGGHGLHP